MEPAGFVIEHDGKDYALSSEWVSGISRLRFRELEAVDGRIWGLGNAPAATMSVAMQPWQGTWTRPPTTRRSAIAGSPSRVRRSACRIDPP